MKIMLMAASLRKDSVNKKLIRLVAKLLESQKHDIDLAEFSEFNAPLYDGDIEANQGIPEGANAFAKRMQASDALIISSPEYNFSMPGTLKNLIDWVSRIKPLPFAQKKIYLMSASPSLVGGNRGLWSIRIPLEATNALVYPSMFSLASAYDAFTEEGALKDEKLQERLVDDVASFVSFCQKLK